jgi:sec-independent protein translocase protein TatC
MTVIERDGTAHIGAMPLTGHLAELRNRIIWSALAIALGGSLGFAWGEPIIDLLRTPLPQDVKLIQLELGDGFAIRIQIAFVVGVILAMPVLLWHLWRFIAPGLTASERRAVLPWIPTALVFFAVGVGIAYVILPFAATFLLSFVPAGVDRTINIRSYFDFMSTLFLAFGALMEYPIVLIGLSRVGIVTSERLRRSRRVVILAMFIFAAVATPGGDLVSPTVLWVALYVLFEGTILFIRRTGR